MLRRFTLGPLLACVLCITSLDACRESEPDSKDTSKSSRPSDQPQAGLEKDIEEFTGAHTRIVWAENMAANEADTFAFGNKLVLKGIDTRDGKGERMILGTLDNYSRPLLAGNGQIILFTDKDVKSKDGRKHYSPHIYRTDWLGSKPKRISEGYAVDCWRDPKTQFEWVYATRDFPASNSLTLQAKKLVRFPLYDPSKVEVIYDETRISPDNIQLSRDGARASGLFPWPNVGILVEGSSGRYHAKKLQTGCWPSMAPDDSEVSWVFDGGHRSASFFAADGRKPWRVKFNTAPSVKGHEVYHPRWSNHPRYFALTGPYVPVKGSSGNVINKGGASANVLLGRFSDTLDKVEAWFQVTRDNLSESFPDVWIAGADKVQLAAFSKKTSSEEEVSEWPAITDSLLFLWHDRNSMIKFKGTDGRPRASAPLEAHGTARYGRFEEMIVEDGQFEMDAENATDVLAAFRSSNDVTAEMFLLPRVLPWRRAATELRPIFRAPNCMIAEDLDGHLLLSNGSGVLRGAAPLPKVPFHLVVVRRNARLELRVDGAELTLEPGNSLMLPPTESVLFGGGWDGGILGVAIYKRGLSDAEVKQHARIQSAMHAKLPPPPRQVRVLARLVEASSLPTPEGIAPYTGSLVAYVYTVEKVLAGNLKAERILVKHWAMLDKKLLAGFPREIGKSYELTLESEEDHPHLEGERVMDDTTEFELEPWFDVDAPRNR